MIRTVSIAILAFLCNFLVAAGHAQTLNVLHAFSGSDGANPFAGLTWDGKGNAYGTTLTGGNLSCPAGGCGSVFKMSHSSTGWAFSTIYRFQGASDGWEPEARVILGADGNLYGTTEFGGNQPTGTNGYGTVFKLTPSTSGWTHTVLYAFTGGSDGAIPGYGDLIFDATGNIYGTTQAGGVVASSCTPLQGPGCGVVFELSPSSSGWTEHVVYSFTGGNDGNLPIGGVVFDPKGNLLGTASEGGASGAYGTVFQLIPSASGWQEKTLHSFTLYEDGGYPAASLLLDRQARAFYGTTSASLVNGVGGTIFQLIPSPQGYAFQTDYLLPYPDDPEGALVVRNSRLYGTTISGGIGFGNVFELTQSSGVWTYQSLYNFTAGNDGWEPFGNVLVDGNGNAYGTAGYAGQFGDGVVYQLKP